jgi:hypothetical protein
MNEHTTSSTNEHTMNKPPVSPAHVFTSIALNVLATVALEGAEIAVDEAKGAVRRGKLLTELAGRRARRRDPHRAQRRLPRLRRSLRAGPRPGARDPAHDGRRRTAARRQRARPAPRGTP